MRSFGRIQLLLLAAIAGGCGQNIVHFDAGCTDDASGSGTTGADCGAACPTCSAGAANGAPAAHPSFPRVRS